jgi:hypothetical protein
VTLARRLTTLETSLTPTQLVLRWLDEAHAFGDLESYVRSQLAEPSLEGPLDRLAREAASGARASLRGKRPEIVDAAVRSALRETVFRFDLVMRILVTTHDLVEREGLIDGALSAHLALLTTEGRATRRRGTRCLERFATLRGLLLFRVAELQAAQEARKIVEARYLAGHSALFPDAAKAWDAQVKSTETIADLACRLAELDGVPPAEPPGPDAASAHLTELVADLVEPAKTTALEKLDEGRQALATATGWLRAKFGLDALEKRQLSSDLHEAAHRAGSSLWPREPAMPSPETGAAYPRVRLRERMLGSWFARRCARWKKPDRIAAAEGPIVGDPRRRRRSSSSTITRSSASASAPSSSASPTWRSSARPTIRARRSTPPERRARTSS